MLTLILTSKEQNRLKNQFGDEYLSFFEDDPYLLVWEIPNIKFHKIDDICLDLAKLENNISRIRAAICSCLYQQLCLGESLVEKLKLVELTEQLLLVKGRKKLDAFLVQEVLETLLDEKLICSSVEKKKKKKMICLMDVAFFIKLNLNAVQMRSLIDKFGSSAGDVIQADPYSLVWQLRMDWKAFKNLDKIAVQLHLQPEMILRIRSAIVSYLNEQLSKNGHSCIAKSNLLKQLQSWLSFKNEEQLYLIDKALEQLCDEEIIGIYKYDHMEYIGLWSIFQMECYLAKQIYQFKNLEHPHQHHWQNVESLVDSYRDGLNLKQFQALCQSLRGRMTVLSGQAGTGKTFSIQRLRQIYEFYGLNIVLLAPTGKAARRMEQMVGQVAFTIHRFLGYDGERFRYGQDNTISADVLIIDESSMIDVTLAWQLFQSVDWTKTAVHWIGDHQQLPPVGPGNFFRDLISSDVLPTTVLDEVIRHDAVLESNCTAILNGILSPSQAMNIADTVNKMLPSWLIIQSHSETNPIDSILFRLFNQDLEKLGFDIVSDVQVICPSNKGDFGTYALNKKLQKWIQEKKWNRKVDATKRGKIPFFKHDKVIQTRNHYSLNLFNGMIAYVEDVIDNRTVILDFEESKHIFDINAPELKELQLAYALTVHKTQGSEFPCVIVVLDHAYRFMHHRNLIYSAVTRASKCVIIIGDDSSLQSCVVPCQEEGRHGLLPLLLSKNNEVNSLFFD